MTNTPMLGNIAQEVHRVAQSNPKVKCEICGGAFGPRYIYNHKRNAHGIFGGATGRPRRPNGGTRPTSRPLGTGKSVKSAANIEVARPTAHEPEPIMNDVLVSRGEGENGRVVATSNRPGSRPVVLRVTSLLVAVDENGRMYVAEPLDELGELGLGDR